MLSTDARDFLVDKSNDLVVGSDLSFSRGLPGIIQACLIVLQMFQGEWFLDQTAGIPYWQSLFRQKPGVAIQAARTWFRSALEGVDGVLQVTQLVVAFDASSRTLSVTWAVSTQFGDSPSITTLVTVGSGAPLNQAAA